MSESKWADVLAENEKLRAEVERLRGWKAEATEVILGLQDLGKALSLPLGERITGAAAAEAATRLTARAEKAEAECRDRESSEQDVRARLADAEGAIERTREYVAHPGNWGTYDGRRHHILWLLDGNKPDPALALPDHGYGVTP